MLPLTPTSSPLFLHTDAIGTGRKPSGARLHMLQMQRLRLQELQPRILAIYIYIVRRNAVITS